MIKSPMKVSKIIRNIFSIEGEIVLKFKIALKLNYKFFFSFFSGNISSGKSTILNYLLSNYSSLFNKKEVKCIEEPLHEWNELNLLKLFYEEKERWSFTFENYVQLSRLRAHVSSFNDLFTNETITTDNNKIIFTERSLWSSYHVFTKNSFAEKRITQIEFNILKAHFDFFSRKLITDYDCKSILPFKIIYLRTDPNVCYERLRLRNREAETTVNIDYLLKIHLNYETWINSIIEKDASLVTVIDSNADKKNVLEQLYSKLPSRIM